MCVAVSVLCYAMPSDGAPGASSVCLFVKCQSLCSSKSCQHVRSLKLSEGQQVVIRSCLFVRANRCLDSRSVVFDNRMQV